MAPVAILLLWWVHVALLAQPLGRGFAYGVFWGLLATAAIVGASRSEKARRGPLAPPVAAVAPGAARRR